MNKATQTIPPLPKGIWLENKKEFYERLKFISESDQEICILLTLTADDRLIGEHILGIGGLSEVIIDLRILFQRVITDKCDKFIIAHNHTDGSGIFSDADIHAAIRMQYVSNALGITFIDSLLFPYQKKPSSMKEKNKALFEIDFETMEE